MFSPAPSSACDAETVCPCLWRRSLMYLGIGLVTLLAALAIQYQQGMSEDYFDPDGWGKRGFWLAEGKGLVDAEGKPSAMRGPVPPLIYGAAAWLVAPNYDVLRTVQAIFFALSAVLVAAISMNVFNRWRVALLTGFMMIGFVPAWPWLCNIFSEPIFTALLAAFLLCWVKLTDNPKSVWRWMLLGLLLGLTALTRPVMYFFVPFVLIDAAWRLGWKWRVWKVTAWLLLGFAIVEGPWIVRNYRVLGRVIPTTSGSAQALHLLTWYQQANWMGDPYDKPERFPPAAEGFWQLPKDEQDQRFRQMAWENMERAPGQVLLLIPRRAMIFFFQMRETGWLPSVKSMVLNSVLYPTAILGFYWAGRLLRRRYCPILILIGFTALFHTLLQSEYRYSHPIQPYIMMLSAFGLWQIAERVWNLINRGGKSKAIK